jgi:endonuclease G
MNRILKLSFLLFSLNLIITSCNKSEQVKLDFAQQASEAVYSNFPETFESGTKTSYTAANVALTSGSWNFNDALIGNLTTDRKNGTKSARIQNTGSLTMNFDLTNGASKVTINHAVFGTDATSTWGLFVSTTQGAAWTQIGTNITTSSTALQNAVFTISYTGNVRFQIKKLSGGRLNIDDISIEDNSNSLTMDDNIALGNPSAAATDVSAPNNYLLVKPQYVLSYNNARGTANWVSWHLSAAWKGSAVRCDCFTQDTQLPSSFFRATTTNYTNTGFDRGHLCPSEDRDLNSTDNAATFKMSNIIPQAPILNQQTWANFENYCRTLLNQGNEIYIISGAYGSGGTGSLGGTTTNIANGSITVPSRCYKIAVVLPLGNNDLTRVSSTTRVIAIDIPNNQTVNSQTWGAYRTSVDNIEAITGYNFLSNVALSSQTSIEAIVDNGPTQ